MTKADLRKQIKELLKSQKDQLPELSAQICSTIINWQVYKNAGTVLAYMALPDEVNLDSVIQQALKDEKKVYIPKVNPDCPEMDFYQYKGKGSLSSGAFGIQEPEEKDIFCFEDKVLSPHNKTAPCTGSATYNKTASHTNNAFYNSSAPCTGTAPCNGAAQHNILILVPGRAFNFQGARLGRGKAYYDTYLSRLNRSLSISQAAKNDISATVAAATNNISVSAQAATNDIVTFAGICFSCQIVPDIPLEPQDIPMHYLINEKGLHQCS